MNSSSEDTGDSASTHNSPEASGTPCEVYTVPVIDLKMIAIDAPKENGPPNKPR
jgi:hypothetical protein